MTLVSKALKIKSKPKSSFRGKFNKKEMIDLAVAYFQGEITAMDAGIALDRPGNSSSSLVVYTLGTILREAIIEGSVTIK